MTKEHSNTRFKILEKLLDEDLTAIQLARKMDLSESTIREHLKTLHEENYADFYFDKATKGRPKKKYTMTKKGREFFPKKYHFVLSLLLRKLKTDIGEDKLREIVTKIASDVTDVNEELLKKDFETRIKKLVEFEGEADAYPSWSRENGSYLLKLNNCGVQSISKDVHETMCCLCKQVILNFLPDSRVKKLKSIAKEDSSCTFKIIPKK